MNAASRIFVILVWLGVLILAGTQGSKIQVEAIGEDAEKAVKAIEKLIDNRFNETE